MNSHVAAAALVIAMTACQSTPSTDGQDQVVEDFMGEYTRVWNTHDAAQIAQRFYRMGPSVQEQTATLGRNFDALRAQGYQASDIHEIKACVTSPDTAWAGTKYSRLRADGTALPPTNRASNYELRKFFDGWRILKVTNADAELPLACPVTAGTG